MRLDQTEGSAQNRQVAETILEGFLDYRAKFQIVTLGAKNRFLQAEWVGIQKAGRDRIGLYKQAKQQVVNRLDLMGWSGDDGAWHTVRAEYELLIATRSDVELAGTFFNTIFRSVGRKANLSDDVAFVTADPRGGGEPASVLTIKYRGDKLVNVVKAALLGSELNDFATIDNDVEKINAILTSSIPILRNRKGLLLELLKPVFYRNKGAYLFGRLLVDQHIFPLAIAIRYEVSGLVVDAALWGEARLSVIFSFTRSYFMVDIGNPAQLVRYLSTLLPAKKQGELYSALGFYKHGKTEFMRGYQQHLRSSDEQFVVAEGIKGQVMMVFGLLSYQTVFKVIKDKFPATKSVTRQGVRSAYQLVKTHDRVGRMADTQEFQDFSFPRDRFTQELLDELLKVAAGSVQLVGDTVVIAHLYTERLMTPLNLYIQRCDDFQLDAIMDDYGRAIKELAAANIFPGDMLLKNFGVTRHGRVVFYDYDEICYLTDITFRELPQASSVDELDSAEPWYGVGEFDVFPAEFSRFLFPSERVQGAFEKAHCDLFTVAGWTQIQAEVRDNELNDVYPYPLKERLS